ncbi:MAG: hypothetical protein HIU93_14720 [Acidobacteria bacterium]|nr:hypothetical protein [Acidobacteriota bacterium]
MGSIGIFVRYTKERTRQLKKSYRRIFSSGYPQETIAAVSFQAARRPICAFSIELTEAIREKREFVTVIEPSWGAFRALTLQGVTFGQLHEVGDGYSGPVKAAHVTAELKAGNPAGSPDGDTNIALVLQLESGWHVYWINAGNVSEPPSAEWVTPAGVSVGPMQFPTPKRLPVGPLMNYGYEGTAVFPFAVKRNKLPSIAAEAAADSEAHIQAHVRWLVCREVCIPGKAFLGVNLPRSATLDQRGTVNEAARLCRFQLSLVSLLSGQWALGPSRCVSGTRTECEELYPITRGLDAL